jgi:hypothetical protein
LECAPVIASGGRLGFGKRLFELGDIEVEKRYAERRTALRMFSKDPSRRVNSLVLFFVPFILKGHIRPRSLRMRKHQPEILFDPFDYTPEN